MVMVDLCTEDEAPKWNAKSFQAKVAVMADTILCEKQKSLLFEHTISWKLIMSRSLKVYLCNVTIPVLNFDWS